MEGSCEFGEIEEFHREALGFAPSWGAYAC